MTGAEPYGTLRRKKVGKFTAEQKKVPEPKKQQFLAFFQHIWASHDFRQFKFSNNHSSFFISFLYSAVALFILS